MPSTLTPQEFVDKWRGIELKERSASQEHFIDLCRLIGHPTPVEGDATGETYCFEAIAHAAQELVEKRDRWLNPEGADEKELKKRTLTDLYNQRPTWLDLAHQKLDRAVLDAYGWPHDITDEQILERLLTLNLERSDSAV